MAWWIELQCDVANADAPCRDHIHDIPGILVRPTRMAAAAGMRYLEDEARQLGYKRTAQGWVCRNCRTAAARWMECG